MILNLKCPCCGYTETVSDERSSWLVCPKCQTVVERQKPTIWLNQQKTLIHIEYGSADIILERSEALSLSERLPSLVGQMEDIAPIGSAARSKTRKMPNEIRGKNKSKNLRKAC